MWNCENIHFPCCRIIFVLMQYKVLNTTSLPLVSSCIPSYSLLQIWVERTVSWPVGFSLHPFLHCWHTLATYYCLYALWLIILATCDFWLVPHVGGGTSALTSLHGVLSQNTSVFIRTGFRLSYFAQRSYCYHTFRINNSASRLLNEIGTCNMQEDQPEMMKIGPLYLPCILNMVFLQHSAS